MEPISLSRYDSAPIDEVVSISFKKQQYKLIVWRKRLFYYYYVFIIWFSLVFGWFLCGFCLVLQGLCVVLAWFLHGFCLFFKQRRPEAHAFDMLTIDKTVSCGAN